MHLEKRTTHHRDFPGLQGLQSVEEVAAIAEGFALIYVGNGIGH